MQKSNNAQKSDAIRSCEIQLNTINSGIISSQWIASINNFICLCERGCGKEKQNKKEMGNFHINN